MEPLIFGKPGLYGRHHGKARTSNARIAEVRELLATGKSQRAVARELKISRRVVIDIALGRLVEVRGVNQYTKNCFCLDFGELSIDPPDRSSPPGRCSECGAWVHLPCLACQVRQFRQKSR